MGKKAKTMGKPGSPGGKPLQKAAAVPSPGAVLGSKIKKPSDKPAITPKQKDEVKKVAKVLAVAKDNTPGKNALVGQQANGVGGDSKKKNKKDKQQMQVNGSQVQPPVTPNKVSGKLNKPDGVKSAGKVVPSVESKPAQAVKLTAAGGELTKAQKKRLAKRARQGGVRLEQAPSPFKRAVKPKAVVVVPKPVKPKHASKKGGAGAEDNFVIADDVSESEDEDEARIHSYDFQQDMKRISAQAGVTIQAILDLIEQKKEKDILFRDAPTRIMMDYFSFKQPEVRSKCITVTMPHSIYPEDPDYLLIIQDDKKNNEDFLEPEFKAANFKKKLLEEHGVKIREVLTMKQLATEYNTYELKEKLIRSVDAIFVQRSIRKYIPNLFGMHLYKKKRYLIPVNFAGERNPGEELKKAFKKVIIPIPIHGKHGVAIVGTEQLTVEQLKDNIAQVCWKLNKVYPGGWENIARIYLSLPYSNIPRIPVYFALGYWDEVKEMLPLRKPDEDFVEDELSTVAGEKKIRVYADGRIEFVGKDSDDEDESDLEFVDDDEEFEDDPVEDPQAEAENAEDGSSDDE